jgi:hypothetical protein
MNALSQRRHHASIFKGELRTFWVALLRWLEIDQDKLTQSHFSINPRQATAKSFVSDGILKSQW